MIAAFDESHRNLALSDLARRAGLALPTAHRLAGELVVGGALQRNDDGRYMVGRLLWEAGLLAPVAGALRQVAEPFLHDVYAATLATVHLAVRDGDQVLYLERMRGRASAPILSSAGSRLPMHCTGVGKVLLAHAPQDVQARVFANLTRVTPYTIVSRSVLSNQLDQIRRGGVASTTGGNVARCMFFGRPGDSVLRRCRGRRDRRGGAQLETRPPAAAWRPAGRRARHRPPALTRGAAGRRTPFNVVHSQTFWTEPDSGWLAVNRDDDGAVQGVHRPHAHL